MSLPSLPACRVRCLTASLIVAGLSALTLSTAAGATDVTSTPDSAAAPLTVVVSGTGGAFATSVVVSCETPTAPSHDGVEIGSAATATRHAVAVATNDSTTLTINDLTHGTACSVTASGAHAPDLQAVTGGVALFGSNGQLRGVAVTADRGTPVTAHLTFNIPAAIDSAVPHQEDTVATDAVGSGSAASTPPLLPGGDSAASAAAPVALAAARSTTTASSAALPDPSGSGTVLVLASLGVLLCGASAYALVLVSRRQADTR